MVTSYVTDDGYRYINPDGPEAADRLASQQSELSALRQQAEAMADKLDTERYKVASALQQIRKAIGGRQWLSEGGRGSYTYDDERYQQEFGAALTEIEAALEPLRAIAADWLGCPTDPLRVAANREAALQSYRSQNND
jgi:septal ring factor EnvC (AmiA/AmiB activator)